MPDLEVTIFSQKIKLSYEENEKQRLMYAVDALNVYWKKFSKLHGKVSDLKIVTLITLELQDSIGDFKVLKDKLDLQEQNINLLKDQIERNNNQSLESSKIINKYKLDIDNKNKEISKIEKIIDEIHDELLEIKKNILANHE
tara:strand:- start:776 stop:1201 length:426 start_codon:yes stop_codon:yes gene_type:complete